MILDFPYRGGRGGSEEFAELIASGLGWLSEPFLSAGAGAFRRGPGPGGFSAAELRSSEPPGGLGVRFGAGCEDKAPDTIIKLPKYSYWKQKQIETKIGNKLNRTCSATVVLI